MSAKFVLILFSFLFVNICLNVCSPPCPTYMRSEPLVTRLEMDIIGILPLTILCLCLFVYILSHIDLDCRFIPFNTRLNTLSVPVKDRSHEKLIFFLLFLSYLLIFDYFVVVFLPFEFWKGNLDILSITKKAVILVKMFHNRVASTTSCTYFHLG